MSLKLENCDVLEIHQQQRKRRVSFHLPAMVADTPHREPLIQISPMPDNTLLVVGQDGLISVWNPDLKLKKNRFILDENKQQNRKMKWVADCTLMPQYNKLIIGTCDRELRFYELSNFEPYCQIIGLETLPLHLGCSTRDTDECVVYFGDEQGCINIIFISRVAETIRNWTKCQIVDDIPSVSMDIIESVGHVKYIRWKVHNDWVTQIRYVHTIDSIISSSNDDYTALVIGCVEGTKNMQKRLKDLMDSSSTRSKRSMLSGNVPPKRNISDESLFKVKRGVKAFDFCKEGNILVTGGLDRIVRIWNPYVPGWPTGLLRGHSSPITFLQIADENSKIYSVSTDCTVMVWDIEEHTCLINVISKASQIRGEIATCFFSPHFRALYIATDSFSMLQLQDNVTHADLPSVSHKEPVTCCQYNQYLEQVVSCSEGSVIKIWDLLTGKLVSEVRGAHGSSAINCLALDNTGNRMFSGAKDGSLKEWDLNSTSISCLKTLKEAVPDSSTERQYDCTYAWLHNNRFMISVGCDKHITIYPDQQDSAVLENQYLNSTWIGELRNRHKDEILCVASFPPNLVASSSSGGEIFIWNVISGTVICSINAPKHEGLSTETGSSDDLIIKRLIFLNSRDWKNECAVLVASGPKGLITFWHISDGGKVFGSFPGSHYEAAVRDMAISEDDSTLCAADQLFYVYIWNISQYALHGPEAQPPPLIHCWRAHSYDITRVVPVVKHKLVVTSSVDCTVRLWSMKGEPIGTFGQSELWDAKKRESWKDQQSDSRVNKDESPSACDCGAPHKPSSEEENIKSDRPEFVGISVPMDDKDIAEELYLRNRSHSAQRVKMLGPKQVELHQTCGKLNAYQSLQICDLMSVTTNVRRPNPAEELNDLYDLAF
ncbi:WD repeat-containing protein 64 [Xenopus laevis]|uniref:WD repeat-containing protein 64 n=2 Tax=Xenopus laevis TaxID=8355 RepID=A0A1L8HLZ0_XENLA|nr:WD repeat-containing protein 64 [Xenopus laevis]OCT97088.1 hypothetical protein XELAEV_18009311mg [Xenopus laevis]